MSSRRAAGVGRRVYRLEDTRKSLANPGEPVGRDAIDRHNDGERIRGVPNAEQGRAVAVFDHHVVSRWFDLGAAYRGGQ
jgi:hypothetical protein